MKVLVTGSSGRVGTAIMNHLPKKGAYDVTGLDIVDHPEHETIVADLRDSKAVHQACADQDAIVHAGHNVALNSETRTVQWNGALLDNLWSGTLVFQAAAEANVDSVVYASSNHGVGGYEDEHAPELYDLGYELTLGPDATPRPDSLYAVQKLYDESMGRFVATQYDLAVYAIRIGNVQPPETDSPHLAVAAGEHEPGSTAHERQIRRMRAMWFSRRDVANMIDACLRDDTVSFNVFYGVSDNERSWFDIEHAKRTIGYTPADDGEAAPPTKE